MEGKTFSSHSFALFLHMHFLKKIVCLHVLIFFLSFLCTPPLSSSKCLTTWILKYKEKKFHQIASPYCLLELS